jgi:transcriptional regulator with GAF, ATPase, and Fis domain
MSEENSHKGEPTRQARTSAGAAMESGLGQHLSELARDLEMAKDTKAVMLRIVTAAVDEIEGAIGSAITLLTNGKITSPVHSDPLAEQVGQIQATTKSGPCVETSRDEITIRSDDLNKESRWPEFTSQALELGVQSVLSFQLFVEGDSMGALDVYGGRINAFDTEAENTGLLLASHAAIAMAASRDITNLKLGMENRDIIGQAKGILMERFKIAPHEAFDLLVMASQSTHRKLREVADELAATGELAIPTPSSRRHGR